MDYAGIPSVLIHRLIRLLKAINFMEKQPFLVGLTNENLSDHDINTYGVQYKIKLAKRSLFENFLLSLFHR